MQFIVDDIKGILNDYPWSKLVVTGLDRCGKSTFLDKNFPEFSRYHSSGYEYYDVNWLVEIYKIFDRHPLIEPYVYMTKEENKEIMLKIAMESLKVYYNSVFVFFLYPRYRDKRADEFDYSDKDELFTQRYHEIAMRILEEVKGSVVIEILPNQIRRYSNDK